MSVTTSSHRTDIGLSLALVAALFLSGFLPGKAIAQPANGPESTPPSMCSADTTIETTKGPVCGLTGDGVTSWMGIPYGAPAVGDLRWAAPQPRAAWTSTFKALQAGDMCPQPGGRGGATSEDCLNLNVQAPADRGSKPLPVMVEIHGGGFLFFGPPPGAHLVKTGNIVYVAMNYRLGIFGFLANKAFGPNSGDYALQDQQAALRWVQDNIARFGGDPHNVTIFGQSAGGASVCANAVSPTAKGLFQKGISESGFYNSLLGGNNVWAAGDCKSKLPSLAEAEEAGARFAAEVGCGDVADVASCLRQVPVKTLLEKAGSAMNVKGGGTIAPTVNGTTLPMSPGKAFATGDVNDVILMIGADRDEINGGVNAEPVIATTPEQYEKLVRQQYGDHADKVMELYPLKRFPSSSPFIAYRTIVADSDSVCPALETFGRAAKYMKVFAWEGDNSDAPRNNERHPLGAFHDTESAFNLPRGKTDFNPNQDAYQAQVNAQWIGFARTGNPTVEGTPLWTPYTEKDPGVMSLRPAGDSVMTYEIGRQHHCDFWRTLLPFDEHGRS